MRKALIVDDELDILDLLSMALRRIEVAATPAADVAEAKRLLDSSQFDFCLTDLRLPDGDGLDILNYIQAVAPDTPCAVITAHGDVDTAVEALKLGAFDFVAKPVDLDQLRKLADSALRLKPKAEQAALAEEAEQENRHGDLILGQSDAIKDVKAMIAKIARSQAPVHVAGESGTGKELVAKMIHMQGPRADAAFVPVNCGAIPAELMESEFFGHMKGSFTSAIADKPGLFQAAEGGTLFLDEVADLPLALQVKLLRAIQERRVRPVGAEQEIDVDIRIISATHKDLADMTRQGLFREDLYYRLNVIELRLPPLRERGGDIPLLANHILNRNAEENGEESVPQLNEAALAALNNYAFPGNVRELENVLERAAILCEAGNIDVRDLRLDPLAGNKISSLSQPLRVGSQAEDESESITASPDTGLRGEVEDLERQRIRAALEKTRYNKTEAAKLLGLSFRQLRYRLKKLEIE